MVRSFHRLVSLLVDGRSSGKKYAIPVKSVGRHVNEQVDGRVRRCVYEQVSRQVHVQVGGQVYEQVYGQVNNSIERNL